MTMHRWVEFEGLDGVLVCGSGWELRFIVDWLCGAVWTWIHVETGVSREPTVLGEA